MALAFSGYDDDANSNETFLIVTKPVPTSQGDLLVAAIHVNQLNSDDHVSAPAGWTVLKEEVFPATSDYLLKSFYKIATASEPATYTFTWATTGTIYVGFCAAYSGIRPFSPLDIVGGQTASQIDLAAPAITTTRSGELLILIASATNEPGATFSVPAGYTLRGRVGSSNTQLGLLDKLDVAAGVQPTTAVTVGTAPVSSAHCRQHAAFFRRVSDQAVV